MKQIMIAAALAALVSAPTFAQSRAPASGTGARPLSAFGAVTPFGSPLAEPSRARDASIRECNAAAAKTYPVRDSNWSISLYRACMAQHGQPE